MTPGTGSRPGGRHFRVVVGDHDRRHRDELVAGLTALGYVEVAGAATNGSDVVIEAWRHRPDVVLLDLTLPGMSAAETTRHITRAAPNAAVCLLVTAETDPGIAEALDAGARDCLVKTATAAQIATVLQRVSRE